MSERLIEALSSPFLEIEVHEVPSDDDTRRSLKSEGARLESSHLVDESARISADTGYDWGIYKSTEFAQRVLKYIVCAIKKDPTLYIEFGNDCNNKDKIKERINTILDHMTTQEIQTMLGKEKLKQSRFGGSSKLKNLGQRVRETIIARCEKIDSDKKLFFHETS